MLNRIDDMTKATKHLEAPITRKFLGFLIDKAKASKTFKNSSFL